MEEFFPWLTVESPLIFTIKCAELFNFIYYQKILTQAFTVKKSDNFRVHVEDNNHNSPFYEDNPGKVFTMLLLVFITTVAILFEGSDLFIVLWDIWNV